MMIALRVRLRSQKKTRKDADRRPDRLGRQRSAAGGRAAPGQAWSPTLEQNSATCAKTRGLKGGRDCAQAVEVDDESEVLDVRDAEWVAVEAHGDDRVAGILTGGDQAPLR